jgi:hypothetical protein
VPVWDESARHDGTFSRADFVFDQERNVYICPGGAELTSIGNIDQGHIVLARLCHPLLPATEAVLRWLARTTLVSIRPGGAALCPDADQ